ncbi:hypothetical protein HZS61_016949 [Fusarium oxysporum f. sp. conglutinans]|uniref:Uncharacterized protein n=1 Tax=Fusarium oxysporum f. sp. conglutinans TaxID=100902 RepID=A0A8H6GJA9_FUSOX|nr:hypothetical protein HZS61_016949 [Fusarium oxysporum f. sp. conglutinans]
MLEPNQALRPRPRIMMDGLIREAFIKMMRRKVHQHARHAPPAVRGTEQDLESCENQIATAHDVLTGAKASYDMAKAQKGEIQLKLEALLAEKRSGGYIGGCHR